MEKIGVEYMHYGNFEGSNLYLMILNMWCSQGFEFEKSVAQEMNIEDMKVLVDEHRNELITEEL